MTFRSLAFFGTSLLIALQGVACGGDDDDAVDPGGSGGTGAGTGGAGVGGTGGAGTGGSAGAAGQGGGDEPALGPPLATGGRHSCLIDEKGEVRCWGRNAEGQLGDGTKEDQNSPVPVLLEGGAPLAGVRALALGSDHSCALTNDGGVLCWGQNYLGQLGDGSTDERSRPVPVRLEGGGPLRGVQALALGGAYSCALTDEGKVLCWGDNRQDQLGFHDQSEEAHPTPTTVGLGYVATALAVGEDHSCAVLSDGRVRCWGSKLEFDDFYEDTPGVPSPDTVYLPGQVPLSKVQSLAVGSEHACVLVQDDGVYCWGYNGFGQLGTGKPDDEIRPEPVKLANGEPLAGAKALTLGADHSCAIMNDGGAVCWGQNNYGQLGDNSAEDHRPNPVPVVLADGTPLTGVRALAAGQAHVCASLEGGALRCWGINGSGQLGDGTDVLRRYPVPVDATPALPLTGVQALGTKNGRHTCVLMPGGEVHCWGDNLRSQLGDGSTIDRLGPVPVRRAGGEPLTGALSVSLGTEHSCVLMPGGEVLCWGANGSGQVGDGSAATRRNPAPVLRLNGSPLVGVEALALGESHSCALLPGGEVHCWGGNYYGQLGDGSTLTRAYPSPVLLASGAPLTGAQAISVGQNHSCALMSDGGLQCWGLNDYGQLGDGTKISRSRPVSVIEVDGAPITGAQALGLGGGHSCAVVTDGAVRCWGGGFYGQLGNGWTEDSSYPVWVSSSFEGALTGVQSLAVGNQHSCALLTDGSVKCWGDTTSLDYYDTYSTVASPVGLANGAPLAGVQSLAAGTEHSCALLAGGAVRCWGGNVTGGLGDGTHTGRLYPVPVELLEGP